MIPISVEATYENGILRPDQPLPLNERERVRVTVDVATNPVRESAGLIPCTDARLIDRIALDVEFSTLESL